MHCPHCRAANNAQAKHCVRCGAALLVGRPSGQISRGEVMRGKYTIQRTLGQGGMGALYLASEPIAGSHRPVVVKEMLDYFDPQDPQGKTRAQRRFAIEAATLASLSVPGVPQIFDYFSDAGRNYIVMQFIEGENLETHLTRLDNQGNLIHGQPYAVDQVRHWGVEICRILEALAGKQIVHMDVKPANLIVDPSGRIWLVDFGTVKAGALAPFVSPAAMKKSSIYGTLGYAAPEQIAGKAEPRSDVYALASTLYHLMTDDDPADPPDTFARMNSLPSDLVTALRRALVNDVRQRVSAAEFGRLLQPTATSASPFRWRDGTESYQPKDLVPMADRNWDEALDYLKGDDWEKWFRSIHQNDLVAKLQTLRNRQANLELALDELLRLLDPTLPAPHLQAAQTLVDMGMQSWKTRRKVDLKLLNRGSGCLQGRCVHLPPGLQVQPEEFVLHESFVLQIFVDTSVLTPSARPHILYLNLESGLGGKLQIPVKVRVPEPVMGLDTLELDFGPVPKGEKMAHFFQVSNTGGSLFLGEAYSDKQWVTIRPALFQCMPGESHKLDIELDSQRLPHGVYAAQVKVCARAGRWEQVEPLNLGFQVSPIKTFLRFWAPPMGFAGIVAAYGSFSGSSLGAWLGRLIYPLRSLLGAVLAGALFAGLSFMLLLALLGFFGGIGNTKGRQGLQNGAASGFVFGAFLGGLAGVLVFRLFAALNIAIESHLPFDPFGSLVGFLSGLVVGLALFVFSRRT